MTGTWIIGDKIVTPAKVLVVEDEPNIRELVCLHLGLEGYGCEGVGDGKEALRRAEAERFDLMVVDLMIPGLDGISLTRAIRNGRTNQDVPILMLTARRRVRIGGKDIELTDQEFRLLHLLATHAGIVFSREALLTKVWRGDTFVTVRSVDTLVKRLRRRIEPDPSEPKYLLTVWGVGYKFADAVS